LIEFMDDSRADRNNPRVSLADIVREATCPACGHHVAVRFFDGGRLPLTTLAWPEDAETAMSMPRLPHAFVRCVDCGHVYNAEFEYEHIPYSDKPNLMFNKGAIWQDHLRDVRDTLLNCLPECPTVVEIGCGDGHLLRALATARPAGRYIGFDLNSMINSGDGLIETRVTWFKPEEHLPECRPDLIISRHVCEHLMNPLGFVQALAFTANWSDLSTRLFIEVPCIDRVFATERTVDFFYEHNSHFTVRSLQRMLERCSTAVELVQTGYDGEVVFGLTHLGRNKTQVATVNAALDFNDRVTRAAHSLRRELSDLAASRQSIAIWGGTGKAAAFVNQYHLDRERFPIVVDSDADKAGTFVPGTGQEILFRDHLLDHPVDTIVIATQWRAADIALEIRRCGIAAQSILVEYQGHMVDYFRDEHPYHPTSETESTQTHTIDADHKPASPQFLSQRRIQTNTIE
jgi:hypothetical protein